MKKAAYIPDVFEKQKSSWLRNLSGAIFVIGIGSSALADEGATFPILNSQAYCAAFVGKMLNEDEKRVEYEKCIANEAQLKSASEPFWHFLPAKTQTMIVNTYFKKESTQTYKIVFHYVSDWVFANKDKSGK